MIGVFDSGLGGLTALAELRRLLPDADLLYFGDTARVPYGSRSNAIITRYAQDIINYLLGRGCDRILAACGTVSTVALPALRKNCPVPLSGIVEAACDAACRATTSGRIGVVATAASIRSGVYPREIGARLSGAEVTQNACPLLVPLVEGGFVARNCEITHLAVREYLTPIREAGCDTLLLGCTHYPILTDIFRDELPGAVLINAGREAARAVAEKTHEHGEGRTELVVSDRTQDMEKVCAILGGDLSHAEIRTVSLSDYADRE